MQRLRRRLHWGMASMALWLMACGREDRARALHDKLDGVSADVQKVGSKVDALQERMKSLEAKVDALAAARAEPSPPPGPDLSAVYAVPIDGDPVEGPRGARVTMVMAAEFA